MGEEAAAKLAEMKEKKEFYYSATEAIRIDLLLLHIPFN